MIIRGINLMANTHMGQPPSNHVTLEGVGGIDPNEDPCETGFEFVRIHPDGSRDPAPPFFRAPANKVFVVTDVDWQYGGGQPRGTQTFRIFIKGSEINSVFESTIILNDSGAGGISEAMTSGFVVASGRGLCVDAFPGGGQIQHVLIRGYLCRDS
jgi:hypothetical protein